MADPIINTNGSGVHPDGERDKPVTNTRTYGSDANDGENSTVDTDNGTTHTRRYGSVDSKNKNVDATGDGINSIHDAAVKSVVDMGGSEEQARNNPNFDNLVKAAEEQIRKNAEATKDM